MPVTTNTAGNAFLTRIYNVTSPDDCKQLYDEWAATYDADLYSTTQDYVAPRVVAQALRDAGGDLGGAVLDAGCGTGLSGIALVEAGAQAGALDGVDISTGMLELARKTGVYARLEAADLCKPMTSTADAAYDVIACAGTLTHAHVGPVPALGEFVRVTKSGGVIAATVLDDIWESGGYAAEVGRLEAEGKVEVLGKEVDDYRRGAGVKARTLVLKKK